MSRELVFMLLGGLGFFFLGMQLMSEGLKKVAGERLRNILHMVTKLPILGVLVGAGITCLIQSSSATTVMVVGFVNAGLLMLKQAIGVVMGANIGTTFTAWLVSSMSVFKVSQYALPLVGIGFAMKAFGKSNNVKFWGQVVMGFAILFVGLDFMKDAFGPLKKSQYVKDMFATFSYNPLLGVLVGTIFTILLQSSSATIAIVQVLAFSGVISFPAAIPLVLGDNIGTTITAQLAAAGSNVNARRAAMSHTLFNVIGVAYMLFFVQTGLLVRGIEALIPGEITTKNVMFYIAIAHSSFNVVNTLIFLPLIGLLEKASIWLVPKRKGAIDMEPQFLEKHLLNTPPIAMEQARRETVRMMELSNASVSTAVESFLDGQVADLKHVSEMEQAVDNLQSAITQYLIELSQRDLSEEESEELPVLIHNVNDIERVGDHSENIAQLAEKMRSARLSFSDEAKKELSSIWGELKDMMSLAEEALGRNDTAVAEKVLVKEQAINKYQADVKVSHVERLNKGVCDVISGVVFVDFVDNLEKIGDHLTNVAQGVISKMRWRDDRHEDDLVAEVDRIV